MESLTGIKVNLCLNQSEEAKIKRRVEHVKKGQCLINKFNIHMKRSSEEMKLYVHTGINQEHNSYFYIKSSTTQVHLIKTSQLSWHHMLHVCLYNLYVVLF